MRQKGVIMSGIYNDDEIIEKDTDTEEKEDKA